jgi:hypothetical protein
LDVGLHGWTTDAKVVADAGERLMSWKEVEDGCLGRCQMDRGAGCCLAERSWLTGHAPNAIRAVTDLSSAKKADILGWQPVRAWAPSSAVQ